MTTRNSSSIMLCALAFAFAVIPAFLVRAQAPAAAPATAAPAAAPEPTAAPAPVAPADTNAAPAPAPAPEDRPSTYTVVAHDSLWKIAHQFGTTVVKLRKLNKLQKGALLHPGQVLQIPPATDDTTTK